MIFRNLLLSVVLFALCGCASKAPSFQYYVLHQPESLAATPATPNQSVILNSLQLPDYLKQRGLVMQTSATQLHFSTLHLWAEPLDNGMTQALRNSLMENSGVLIAPLDMAELSSATRITVLVEDFVATHNGEVVLKGQYWLTYPSKSPQVFLFDFRLPLTQDGFSHAVEQMRKLVDTLGQDIARHLSEQ
ncbi:PqiC family protein [Alteromonas aestuariivivens]|nr:ABC-type transport auxiliary lipoprotein family protein [Alteromonas aestuariivivens]